MKGRAEYENIDARQLFEGVSPTEIFPWVKKPGEGVGMLVGARGLGKTLVALKLAKEIPTNIYELDKRTLDYVPLHEATNPKLIVMDDLHYLLQVMRLGYLQGSIVIDEKEVLQILKDANDDAKKRGVKVVFVGDEGPGALSYNFHEEENRKQFLEILKGCISTTDDTTLIYHYLGQLFSESENVLKLRETIDDRMAVNIRKEFGMDDIPFVIPPGLKSLDRDLARGHFHDKDISQLELGVSPQEPETIYSEGRKEWSPSQSAYSPRKQEKIVSIREAEILRGKLGGLNRKNISGNVLISDLELHNYKPSYIKKLKKEGKLEEIKKLSEPKPVKLESNDDGSWTYKLIDIAPLKRILDKKYIDIIRSDYKLSPLIDLARAVASARSDKEVSILYVKHELGKE